MEENNKINLTDKRIERYIEKLEHIKKIFKKLNEWTKDLDNKDFLNTDLKDRFAIYHAFQIIIEIITDIIAMVVKDIKIKPKDDYANIDSLKDENILSNELSVKIRKLNGLRNVLVHDYNGFDDLLAYKGIKENITTLKEFQEVIKDWLKKNS